jgi:hypothetical protein
MKTLSTAIALALAVSINPSPASAQTPESAAATLRFRQLGDTATLAKGRVDVGVQFASAADESSDWNVTRIGARFGLSDRVDLGAWGGYNSGMSDGMAGMDVKIALVRQGTSMPVSVSVRPSFSSTVGASDRWAASTGVDLTVSRAFGAFAPYAGVAATSSLATEKLLNLDVDRETTNQALSYAGLTYAWRSLVAAVEVEKGTKVSYAFRLGTRF